MRGKQVIPAEEHAAKIASARDAIGDSDFFLVARTDVRATSAKSGLEDAIARVNLYMEAGADASFVEAPRDDDELKEIGKRTKGYRVCNMIEGGVTPLHTPDELKEMGFHLIVHPLTALYASTRALVDVLKTLKENGSTRDHLQKMATFEEFNSLVDLDSWFELEARYSNLRNALGTTKS
jgi:2-methylisocitrate lyase-like PEP mutase family enzyme